MAYLNMSPRNPVIVQIRGAIWVIRGLLGLHLVYTFEHCIDLVLQKGL